MPYASEPGENNIATIIQDDSEEELEMGYYEDNSEEENNQYDDDMDSEDIPEEFRPMFEIGRG